MRRLIFGGLAALVLAFGTVGQPPDTAAAEPDASDPPNAGEDEPAMRILRQMAGYLQETNQLRVHLKMDMRIEAPGMKQEMGYDYTLKLDRPKRFALILNEGPFGVSVYCDGETLTSYLPMQKRYTVSPAPERLGELDESGTAGAMDLGMMMGGGEGLGQFLRGEGLVEEMTKDVEKAEYVGQEELNGIPCHHLKISEAEVDVDVWVEVGDRPLPHRIVPDLSGMYAQMYSELGEGFKEMKVTMAITFADWDVAVQFKEEDFKFTPPEGAEQADSLFDFGDFGGDEEGPHPLLGEPAPQFETTDLEGEPLALEDHLEQNIVLLDFWAEWCGPCREGLPIVSKVAAEFTDKGVIFYAVNLGDDEEAIRDFLKASELELPVALDKDGAIGEMYQANAIPQTVLIGKDGRVQVVHVGLLPNLEDELRQNLNDLLAGKDLATATLEQAAEAAEEAEAEQPDPEPQGLAPVWSVEGSWTGVAVERGAPRAYAVDTKGGLVTLDSAGKELQRHNRQQQSSVLRTGNLLGTEASELLAFDAWGDTLHAFTAEGTLLWQYALGQGIDDVWAADLSGDGLDEVIIGYNGSTGLHVLDNRGTLLWKDTSIGNVWHVSAGDFDGDGSREVVTTSAAGQLHVFSHDGQKLKDIEVPLYANMVRMTPVAREDKSGGIAIVGGSGDRGEQLLAVTYDGEQKWLVDLPDAGVDHIDSAATAPSAGWVAVAMRGGLVHVVEIESGEIIAHVGRQGQTPQVAWLPREGAPPLLVVATGRELNAFRVSATDGER